MTGYIQIGRSALPGGRECTTYTNGAQDIVIVRTSMDRTAAVKKNGVLYVLAGRDVGSEQAALAWAACLRSEDFKTLREWRAEATP